MSVAPPNKPVVLVVDDDQVNQMLLTDVCHAEGYEVVTAGDGEAAIETFREREIDLVLLDVAMPKIDGFTVCRMMLELRPVPVIIVTATNEQQAEDMAQQCGATALMTKPFRVFELSRKMRAAMRTSLTPSEPPGHAEHVRRRDAARALGGTGGAMQLRRSLRKALASESRLAVVLARLDNERQILESEGRTARDAVMGVLCMALQEEIPGVDLYSSDSNELVALVPDVALEAALGVLSASAGSRGVGVEGVTIRWAGMRLAPGGGDVDDVLRALRERTREAAPGSGR